jgi:hypothetical protein
MVPKQIVNRRVRDGRCKELGESAYDATGTVRRSARWVLLRPKRAARRALLEQRGDWVP